MSDASKNPIFTRIFERKLNEVIAWVIVNSPNKIAPLSVVDFAEVREQFCKVVHAETNPLVHEPDPSQGGEQYINVTPSPWP